VQGQDNNASLMRSKTPLSCSTKWKHITLTSWPDGQRVYDALKHYHISDIRKKEIAERRRKKEKRKKEREN
jgi:hypothetical protein